MREINLYKGKKPVEKFKFEAAMKLDDDILKSKPVEYLKFSSSVQKEMMFGNEEKNLF